DTVWHDALLYKLRQLRVPTAIYNFIASFLSTRTCSTRVNDSISPPAALDRGLPQGSSLSCTLWLVMINDIPIDLVQGVTGAIYADDVTLLTAATTTGQLSAPMQRALDL